MVNYCTSAFSVLYALWRSCSGALHTAHAFLG
jgi:hypothetical protein